MEMTSDMPFIKTTVTLIHVYAVQFESKSNNH